MPHFKMDKKTKILFWILLGLFALTITFFVVSSINELRGPAFPITAFFAICFAIIGFVLLFRVSRRKFKIEKKLRIFLILTSASAAGIPVFAILHNLVYALFILLFGENFWGNGDEAVFFILAIIVCPIVFIVGVIGTLILMYKNKTKKK